MNLSSRTNITKEMSMSKKAIRHDGNFLILNRFLALDARIRYNAILICHIHQQSNIYDEAYLRKYLHQRYSNCFSIHLCSHFI